MSPEAKTGVFSFATILVGAAFFFLIREQGVKLALFLGAAALLAPILWLVVSALRPAMPERACPSCKKDSLRLLTPGEKFGVRCPACGFQDAELYVPYLIDIDDDLTDEVA